MTRLGKVLNSSKNSFFPFLIDLTQGLGWGAFSSRFDCELITLDLLKGSVHHSFVGDTFNPFSGIINHKTPALKPLSKASLFALTGSGSTTITVAKNLITQTMKLHGTNVNST